MKGKHWFLVVALAITTACGGDGGGVETPAAEEGPTEVEVIGVDFGFKVTPEEIDAGEISTTLVNEGKEPHQVGWYRLNDGVEYEEFLQEIVADDSHIPQLAEGGRAGVMRPIYPGEMDTEPGVELEAGTYALLCSIRDGDTGKNHYELGMIAKVEVK